jgi:hypothetical protein
VRIKYRQVARVTSLSRRRRPLTLCWGFWFGFEGWSAYGRAFLPGERECTRNYVVALIPLGVPSSSGRANSWFSSCRCPRWFVQRVHTLRMCSRVCRFSPHLLFSGKSCLRNSPVYVCPVRQWTRRSNTSRWSLSSVKCFVGFC